MPASNSFSGTLQLYYMTVDSYAVCTWNMNFELCPDTCKMFYPSLTNIGGAQVLGDAHWEILDANAQQVADGSFTLDTNTQYVVDSACLSPGSYTMKVHNVSLSPGGQKIVSITNFVFSDNPDTTFNDSVAILPFTLFAPCFTPVSVKEAATTGYAVSIYSYGNAVFINNSSGNAIGSVTVYSIDGKRVFNTGSHQSKQQVTLSSVPTGIYIVNVRNETGIYVEKVFIEN